MTIGTVTHASPGDGEEEGASEDGAPAETCERTVAPVAADPVTDESGSTDQTPDSATGEERGAPGAGETRGAMIPREALVDMTRAQSGVICSSEIFLGCMGFDGRECLTLSESAIDQCLMTLPPEIDPTMLDNATLESCPREIYELAGYDEETARQCFEKALDEP